MWESSLGAVYTDKSWGDGKMGIFSVEGFDRDAKFVCEKGMTGKRLPLQPVSSERNHQVASS